MMRDDKGMQLVFGDQPHFLSGIVFTATQSRRASHKKLHNEATES